MEAADSQREQDRMVVVVLRKGGRNDTHTPGDGGSGTRHTKDRGGEDYGGGNWTPRGARDERSYRTAPPEEEEEPGQGPLP